MGHLSTKGMPSGIPVLTASQNSLLDLTYPIHLSTLEIIGLFCSCFASSSEYQVI